MTNKRFRPALLATALLIGASPLTSLSAAPLATIEAATKQAVRHVHMMAFRIRMFHEDARNSMLTTMQLPLIGDYFALPETQHNRYTAMGILQQTPQQKALRSDIEAWVLGLHDRFPIAETCLIDQHGQEHMRVVGGEVQPADEFSSDESGAPFFSPTLKLQPGQVHFSNPYMSEDALRWVFSVTSPAPSVDGRIPGFYHFELPLKAYQQIISTTDFNFASKREGTPDSGEEGRYVIINDKLQLVADSHQTIRYEIVDRRNPQLNPDLPDFLPPERLPDYLPGIASITQDPVFVAAIKKLMRQESGHTSVTLYGQDYVLAYEPVPDRNWKLVHIDPVGHEAFWNR